jgi:hypothetical protein
MSNKRKFQELPDEDLRLGILSELLGTDAVLDAFYVFLTENKSLKKIAFNCAPGIHIDPDRRKIQDLSAFEEDGLYFSGFHWYSLKSGKICDSLSRQWQRHGNNSYCQVYALLSYISPDFPDLKPLEYQWNIQVASGWVKKFFVWLWTSGKVDTWDAVQHEFPELNNEAYYSKIVETADMLEKNKQGLAERWAFAGSL